MTPDDISRVVVMVSPTAGAVSAIRLKPGHTIDHARLMSLEGASEARVGDKVYVKCRLHHHMYDANTLILTRKDSTMRDLLGRKFIAAGLNDDMKELYREAEPGAIRTVAEASLTNFLFHFSQVDGVLRGNLRDLVGGRLKGMSLSTGLKEDNLAVSVTIDHADSDAARRSEKDFDGIVASWKPNLKKLLKTLEVASGDYDTFGSEILQTVASSSKEKKLIIRAEASVHSAMALLKTPFDDL